MKGIIILIFSMFSLISPFSSQVYAQPRQNVSEALVVDGKATKKEELEYSYKILLDSYNKYLDNVFKTIGFLIVMIGWLITSENSRLFFQENKLARNIFLGVISVMWLIHALSLIDNYREGTRIMDLIEKLDYIKIEYFDRYRPKLYKTIGSLILDSALFVLLFAIVYRFCDASKKTKT